MPKGLELFEKIASRTDIGHTEDRHRTDKKLRTYILTPYFLRGHKYFSSFLVEDIHFSICLIPEDIHLRKKHRFKNRRKPNPMGFSFLLPFYFDSLAEE